MNIKRLIQFLRSEIWRIRENDFSQPKSFFLRVLRIIILAVRGFTEDRCQLRASALTFYSLLSIVPVLAMTFGIAKGFGFENMLERVLLERFQGHEQVVAQVVKFAHALLENVKGGLVAGIGIIVLFYTIIKILSHIESSFNHIWGIKSSRPFVRKISDYFSLMLICPLLFTISSAATVIITSGTKLVVEKVSLLQIFGPFIFFTLKFLPFCMLWILFTFLYMFIPNTKIQFKSGMLAGIIAGTIYYIFQWAYINFQIDVSRYNTIYGSFAALPLFFIWLQVSWFIVLFGAEISYAYQNVKIYEFEKDCENVSHSFKKLLSLRIVHLLINRFSDRDGALNAMQIANELEIPDRLTNQILHELVSSGIVSEVKERDEKGAAYQPAVDPDIITVKYVVDAMENNGSDSIPLPQTEELTKLSESFKDFDNLMEQSPANKRLKDI